MTLQRTGGFWSTNWDGSPVQSLSPSFHQYEKDGTTARKIYIIHIYIYIFVSLLGTCGEQVMCCQYSCQNGCSHFGSSCYLSPELVKIPVSLRL